MNTVRLLLTNFRPQIDAINQKIKFDFANITGHRLHIEMCLEAVCSLAGHVLLYPSAGQEVHKEYQFHRGSCPPPLASLASPPLPLLCCSVQPGSVHSGHL